MYICMYVYIHICTYVHVCICIYVYIYIYILEFDLSLYRDKRSGRNPQVKLQSRIVDVIS